VVEELAGAGTVAHLGDPAEIAVLRGPKKRAKSDRADARLLRTFASKRCQAQHLLDIPQNREGMHYEE
jgi:hypothetical protein